MASATTDRRQGLTGDKGFKAPVQAATTANIVLSGEQTIDGVAVKAIGINGYPDRVLVWNQTNPVDNGIWDVSTASWTRSQDSNGTQDLVTGTMGLVASGNIYANQQWILTTAGIISPGSTSLVFKVGVPTLAILAASTGSAAIGAKSSLSGTVATTDFEIQERIRHVFDWLTPNQRAAALNGTGVTDLTTPLQAALDSGSSLDWGDSRCVYGVTKLTFNQVGKTYRFNGAAIIGIDTATQKGVIDWQAGFCTVYGMAVVGNWKSNYVSAIYWHSASAGLPAKSNHFFKLKIDNSLKGILFGEVSPTVPVDAAQSENFIYGFSTRGVQEPIYCNQSNGFLEINGEITASKNEWDIQNPGVYNFTTSCPIQVIQGVIRARGDIEKTDTQLGFGLKNSGGTLDLSGNIEIACQIGSFGGGVTHVHDIAGSFWGNASNSWAVLSGNAGSLRVSGIVVNKSVAASSANTAFIDCGAATNWDVALSELRLENQLNLIFGNGSAQAAMWAGGNTIQFSNVLSPPVGSPPTAPYFLRVSTDTNNLLDLRGTDVIGNDIATWYKRDLIGAGAIALFADAPAGTNYFSAIQVTPNAAAGTSAVYNMDLTSLTTVKATAIKCRPGDTFILSGWFRMTSAGTATVSALWANTSGAAAVESTLADNTNLLTSAWVYINTMFVVPAAGAYLGVGVKGTNATVVRMVGLKLSKLS